MTTIHQKKQILRSLNAMDQEQAEKVLDYIKLMLNYPAEEKSYQRFKNQALQEIRQALGENRMFNP